MDSWTGYTRNGVDRLLLLGVVGDPFCRSDHLQRRREKRPLDWAPAVETVAPGPAQRPSGPAAQRPRGPADGLLALPPPAPPAPPASAPRPLQRPPRPPRPRRRDCAPTQAQVLLSYAKPCVSPEPKLNGHKDVCLLTSADSLAEALGLGGLSMKSLWEPRVTGLTSPRFGPAAEAAAFCREMPRLRMVTLQSSGCEADLRILEGLRA